FGGHDAAVELHVTTQIELVGDIVQIAQVFGLTGEAFLPVPFVQELARERVAVGIALRIEAGAGIAVPVPRAAEAGRELEHGSFHAKFGQAPDLVDAADTGADDDDFVVHPFHVGRMRSSRPADNPSCVSPVVLAVPVSGPNERRAIPRSGPFERLVRLKPPGMASSPYPPRHRHRDRRGGIWGGRGTRALEATVNG